MSYYDIIMVERLEELRADHDAASQKFQAALRSGEGEQIDTALEEFQKTYELIARYKEEFM